MKSNEDEQSIDFEQMEKWLENYFLDPLTSFLDQSQFRIDLYETNQEWIIEATLIDYLPSEINIIVASQKLIINAKRVDSLPKVDNHLKTRTIEFPFSISRKHITASFQNGILEILISKQDNGNGNIRTITLS